MDRVGSFYKRILPSPCTPQICLSESWTRWLLKCSPIPGPVVDQLVLEFSPEPSAYRRLEMPLQSQLPQQGQVSSYMSLEKGKFCPSPSSRVKGERVRKGDSDGQQGSELLPLQMGMVPPGFPSGSIGQEENIQRRVSGFCCECEFKKDRRSCSSLCFQCQNTAACCFLKWTSE